MWHSLLCFFLTVNHGWGDQKHSSSFTTKCQPLQSKLWTEYSASYVLSVARFNVYSQQTSNLTILLSFRVLSFLVRLHSFLAVASLFVGSDASHIPNFCVDIALHSFSALTIYACSPALHTPDGDKLYLMENSSKYRFILLDNGIC